MRPGANGGPSAARLVAQAAVADETLPWAPAVRAVTQGAKRLPA